MTYSAIELEGRLVANVSLLQRRDIVWIGDGFASERRQRAIVGTSVVQESAALQTVRFRAEFGADVSRGRAHHDVLILELRRNKTQLRIEEIMLVRF